jgi:hypothetical protein
MSQIHIVVFKKQEFEAEGSYYFEPETLVDPREEGVGGVILSINGSVLDDTFTDWLLEQDGFYDSLLEAFRSPLSEDY